MKKIFTIAAAVLASFSLMAADATFTMSEIFDGNNQSAEVTEPVAATVSTTASKSNAKDGKLGSDGNYFQIVLADATFSAASLNGYINTTATDKNWAFQFSFDGGANWTDEALQANDGDKTSHDIEVAVEIPLNANGFRVVRRAGTSTIVNSITLTLGAPSTDPVTEVTISGPTEAYVGQKVTLTATTDVKATSIEWKLDDQTFEFGNSVNFYPDVEGDFTFVVYAKNDYNVDPAVSAPHVVSVTVKPALEQVVVTDHTTWDFTKAATVNQIKWEGAQKDAEPIVMANIDGFNNDENFNSQALLFSGEYPIRDGKYCQGPHLEFEINSPGLLTVVYSNTGNREPKEGETEGQESLRRFLTINGNLVPGDAGSMKSNTNTTTEGIAINPGAVVISACMPYGENPTAAQYIRIYKVIYQRTGWPTAIDNTEVGVKAVKMIENGQLVIIKNGVKYNAQGTIVK